MPRQFGLILTTLAGILFLTGLFVDLFSGKTANLHLRLDSWANVNSADELSSASFRLDSLTVSRFEPEYELQVRQTTGEFNQQIHPGIPRPSRLVNAFPLEKMRIRKIGDTPFRFRLQEFYPDFTFQYSYPKSSDTIPPRSPGITLLLKTPFGEEVVTLREDQPKMNKLDDVVQLGSALQFYWSYLSDSLSLSNSDTNNIIIFSGKDKKIYFRFDGITTTLPLELNRFYPIPGKDTTGFTILQCFPDIAHLAAHPASQSDQLNNPVAGVEIWKLEGRSQVLYLYPPGSGKTGGQWEVPGSDLLVTLGLSHNVIAKHCQCAVSVTDSTRQINKQIILKGQQHASFGGSMLKLTECDPNGLWASVLVRSATGYWLMIAGVIGVIVSLIIHFMLRRHYKQPINTALNFS